ncbi:MAG: DUF3833 domain-containing protein [Gammaproteobacteria bacterium]|nr:DUF3833 domain-containing protein [Gammaproteobacteria bacterium]
MKLAVLALGAVLLAACGRTNVQDYQAAEPRLDLARYFNGNLTGWGMVQDRSGRVLRRFTVEMVATWSGNTGVLAENFQWSDGKTEFRRWAIVKNGDTYQGTAGDVVGSAAGHAAGNTLQWRYVLALPVDGATWEMQMDDWMYLIDEDTLVNRTRMSKFGVQMAEISIFFRRQHTPQTPPG